MMQPSRSHEPNESTNNQSDSGTSNLYRGLTSTFPQQGDLSIQLRYNNGLASSNNDLAFKILQLTNQNFGQQRPTPQHIPQNNPELQLLLQLQLQQQKLNETLAVGQQAEQRIAVPGQQQEQLNQQLASFQGQGQSNLFGVASIPHEEPEPHLNAPNSQGAQQVQRLMQANSAVIRSNEIHDHDVLCGRGGDMNKHSGNDRFRMFVEQHKSAYLSAMYKRDKRQIAEHVVRAIHDLQPPGRFLVRVQGQNRRRCRSGKFDVEWYEVSFERAREKASQALREGAPSLKKDKKDSSRKGAEKPTSSNPRSKSTNDTNSRHERLESTEDDSRKMPPRLKSDKWDRSIKLSSAAIENSPGFQLSLDTGPSTNDFTKEEAELLISISESAPDMGLAFEKEKVESFATSTIPASAVASAAASAAASESSNPNNISESENASSAALSYTDFLQKSLFLCGSDEPGFQNQESTFSSLISNGLNVTPPRQRPKFVLPLTSSNVWSLMQQEKNETVRSPNQEENLAFSLPFRLFPSKDSKLPHEEALRAEERISLKPSLLRQKSECIPTNLEKNTSSSSEGSSQQPDRKRSRSCPADLNSRSSSEEEK